MDRPLLELGSDTFIVRLWREAADGTFRWRGRIEHIPSGEHCAFTKMAEMLAFMNRYVLLGCDETGEGHG